MSSEIRTNVCCNELHVVYSLFLSCTFFFFLYVCIYMYVCVYIVERNDLVKQTCSGEKLNTPTHVWCLINELYQFLLKQLLWRLIKYHVVSPYVIFSLKLAQHPLYPQISISLESRELFYKSDYPTYHVFFHLRTKQQFQLSQSKPHVPKYTCFLL